MNYIAAADLHIRSNRPQFRKDDYFGTVCRKFKQIVYLCNKYKADLIIAGDFFDHVKVGHKVVNMILSILQKLNGKILLVAGQHDMSFHTLDLSSSPLQTLIYNCKVILLKKDTPFKNGNDNIYGCSFGEIPIYPEKDSILVIHRTITPKEPPFFLTEAISADEAFNTFPGYSLIISGDYHSAFIVKKSKNALINCGPMMRQSIDQMELQPKVWLINTDANRIVRKEESEFSKDLGELIETLKNQANRPDYKSNVKLLMDKSNISKTTRNRVNSILENVINK